MGRMNLVLLLSATPTLGLLAQPPSMRQLRCTSELRRFSSVTPTPSTSTKPQVKDWEWTSSATAAMTPVCSYMELAVPTSAKGPPAQKVALEDLTQKVNDLVALSGIQEGTVTIISRHTTTGVTINEWESRLVSDTKAWLLQLAPPDRRSTVGEASGPTYRHNDLDQRPDSAAERQRCIENGWNVEDPEQLAAWRAQEPINCHSHLLSILLGSSESIPVAKGRLVLGQWQSIMLVDMDGPRDRTVGIQINGYR